MQAVSAAPSRFGTVEPRPQKFFVASRNPANLSIDRSIGFAVQGFDEFYRDRHPMQPGDLVALYATNPLKGFVATVEVIGELYYDEQLIWEGRDGRVYPYRYATTPRFVLEEGRSLDPREFLDELEIAYDLRDRNRWGVMFQNAVREIPRADFALIERRLRELAASD